MVFEELLLGSEAVDADHVRSRAVSIRSLAHQLGLDKDTAARALQRLSDVGVASRRQARTSAGTFARTTYVIRAIDGLRVIDADADADRTARRFSSPQLDAPSSSRSRPARSSSATPTPAISTTRQLSLLDS